LGNLAWGGLSAGALAIVFLVLVPAWLGNSYGAHLSAEHPTGSVHTGTSVTWWNPTAWSGTAVWAAATSLVAILLGSSTSKGTPALLASPQLRDRIRSTLWKWRAPVANALALIAGPILLAAIAGASVVTGYATDSWTWAVLGAVAVVYALACWHADVVNWSLHPPYRDRLFSCFGATLTMPNGATAQHSPTPGAVQTGAKPLVVAQTGTPLSELGTADKDLLPTITVCAALNVATRAATPARSHVLPWVFTPSKIGIPLPDVPEGNQHASGGDRVPTAPMWNTADLQTALETSNDLRQRVTLQGASAMAAAAVSPSMGRMTRAPLRMLLGLFNVRLGVWMPNPLNATQQRRVDERQGPAPKQAKWHGWVPPYYLFLELFGANSINRKWVYVTDGGHYENLGLVEALRDQDVRAVVCVDAAGDAPGTATTLAQALALARAELGYDIVGGDLGRFALSKESAKGNLRSLATHGVFTLKREEQTVHVVVVRLGLADDTPRDILDYARTHPTFPYDSTANQLYKADRFDAYRALGWDNMHRALSDPASHHALGLPPPNRPEPDGDDGPPPARP
jgi:hypothetical protein